MRGLLLHRKKVCISGLLSQTWALQAEVQTDLHRIECKFGAICVNYHLAMVTISGIIASCRAERSDLP